MCRSPTSTVNYNSFSFPTYVHIQVCVCLHGFDCSTIYATIFRGVVGQAQYQSMKNAFFLFACGRVTVVKVIGGSRRLKVESVSESWRRRNLRLEDGGVCGCDAGSGVWRNRFVLASLWNIV